MNLRIQLMIGAVLFAGIAGAMKAEESAENVISNITGEDLADLIRESGFRAEVRADKDGDPMVMATVNGVKTLILFYNCKGSPVKSCDEIQFNAIWTKTDSFTLEKVNSVNQTRRRGKLYIDPDGNLTAQLTISIVGSTKTNLKTYITYWESITSSVKSAFN